MYWSNVYIQCTSTSMHRPYQDMSKKCIHRFPVQQKLSEVAFGDWGHCSLVIRRVSYQRLPYMQSNFKRKCQGTWDQVENCKKSHRHGSSFLTLTLDLTLYSVKTIDRVLAVRDRLPPRADHWHSIQEISILQYNESHAFNPSFILHYTTLYIKMEVFQLINWQWWWKIEETLKRKHKTDLCHESINYK